MQPSTKLPQVAPLREASREVVRELGMLDDRWGPGDITHSQCHALLELERAGALGVVELSAKLRLDKSVVSRVVRALLARKLVTLRTGELDKRQRRAQLTAAGRKAVAKIHLDADARVDAALRLLDDDERRRVLDGMQVYARALERSRRAAGIVLRPIRAADDAEVAAIIRAVMTEHGAVGPGFAIVDPEVGAMSRHYDRDEDPPAGYFVLDDGERVVGGAGFAHLRGATKTTCELRKMYLRPHTRGCGLGRRLLEHVLEQAHAAGYRRCYLETMATMQRARALYESVGFAPLPKPEGATGHYGCDAWYARAL
jgi:putative acetyltransferase